MLRQLTAGGIPWPINEANRLTQFGRTIHEGRQIVLVESSMRGRGDASSAVSIVNSPKTQGLGVWIHSLIRVLEGSIKCT